MIFLAKGHCFLGRRRVDENGNVVEESAARFEADPKGGSMAEAYCAALIDLIDAEPAVIPADTGG